MAHDEIEHLRWKLKNRWFPFAVALELQVGIFGCLMGSLQIAVTGFGMAAYLTFTRWSLRVSGRW